MTEPCRSCGTPVDFAVSASTGRAMPVDHESADCPGGNLAVWRDDAGRLWFRYLRKGEVPGAGEHRGVSHFATCEHAGQWRRGRLEG